MAEYLAINTWLKEGRALIKNYKTISNRYLKKNRKGTILTIIGIVLSVALITCIGTFILTMQNSALENAKDNHGDLHIFLKNMSQENYDKVSRNPQVDKTALAITDDAVPFVKDKQIALNRVTKDTLTLKRVKVKEGRAPENKEEIAFEQWILKYFDSKVNLGDQITIKDFQGNNHEYKLTGILENGMSSQYEGIVTAYTIDNNIDLTKDKPDVLVRLKDKADKKTVINDIKDLVGKDNVTVNESVLRLTGDSQNDNTNKALYWIASIVIGIVVLATIIVIYNAFHISIAERLKQFGLLRAIGTTKKQTMALVLREATVMSLVAIPIGLFLGVLALYIVLLVFNTMPGMEDFKLKIVLSPLVLLLSAVIGILSVYISAFLPAKTAGKISPLVAISSGNLITKEKNKKGKKWLSKVVRIDKVMAIKNIKRNRKRFYVTTISMAISVTLFVTFMSFGKLTSTLTGKTNEDSNIDFTLRSQETKGGQKEIETKLIDEVSNTEGVNKVYSTYNLVQLKAIIDSNDIPNDVKDLILSTTKNIKLDSNDKTMINITFDVYEKERLEAAKKYVTEGKIDNLKENEVIVIKNNTIWGKNKPIISPLLNVKVGDEILIDSNYFVKTEKLSQKDYEEGKEPKIEESIKDIYKVSELKKVKVAAIVDDEPFAHYGSGLRVIAPKNTVDNLIKDNDIVKNDFKLSELKIYLKDKNLESQVDSKLKVLEEKYPGISYSNMIDFARKEKASIMQMMILLMGFTTVITLISAVNIVNTVATNIIIRKRELAALRAIGMTHKELRRMIMLEGILFGLYGGVIGSLAGTGLSYLLYKQMNAIQGFLFEIPWDIIGVAMIGIIVIGYISAIIPMKKLKRDNIIEALKEV